MCIQGGKHDVYLRICDPYYYEYKIEKLHRKREVIVMYCLIPPGVNKFSFCFTTNTIPFSHH